MTLRRFIVQALLSVLLIGTVAGVSFCTGGCSRGEATAQEVSHTAARPTSFTSKVLSRVDVVARCGAAAVPLPILNDATYAEVNSTWLTGFEDRLQAHLFKDGVIVNLPTGQTGWDGTFDCVYLAEGFIYYASTEYHTDSRTTFWKDLTGRETDAPAGLALVKVYYRPEDAMENHVIVVALTERGAVWFDPQVGEVKLEPVEVKSIYRAED